MRELLGALAVLLALAVALGLLGDEREHDSGEAARAAARAAAVETYDEYLERYGDEKLAEYMGRQEYEERMEGRAVKIAARVMQAAGLCRYDTTDKCRRVYVDESTCEACSERWLLAKARREKEERK